MSKEILIAHGKPRQGSAEILGRRRGHKKRPTRIQDLPDDMLKLLFQLSLPSSIEQRRPVRSTAPLFFTQVCTHWRDLATRYCQLWTSLHLQPRHDNPQTDKTYSRTITHFLQQAQHWFDRASSEPCFLSIKFPITGFSLDSLHVQSQVSELGFRMRKCIENGNPQWLRLEERQGPMLTFILDSPLSKVESLSLVSSNLSLDQQQGFSSSESSFSPSSTPWPKVRRLQLSLHANHPPLWMPPVWLPWNQLTDLSSNMRLGARTWLLVLSWCENLVECTIHVAIDKEMGAGASVQRVKMKALQSLCVNVHAEGVEMALCARLWCPALQKFRLNRLWTLWKACNPISTFLPPKTLFFNPTKLKSLTLMLNEQVRTGSDGKGSSIARIMELLALAEHLGELVLEGTYRDYEVLFEKLASSRIVPRLRILKIFYSIERNTATSSLASGLGSRTGFESGTTTPRPRKVSTITGRGRGFGGGVDFAWAKFRRMVAARRPPGYYALGVLPCDVSVVSAVEDAVVVKNAITGAGIYLLPVGDGTSRSSGSGVVDGNKVEAVTVEYKAIVPSSLWSMVEDRDPSWALDY
ncbi:hypothetical protein FA15DRAFT_268208 [Coprinopsis marcescibilis]|uniref:F-box domain-containing protein n=1 Tax=Coprinopsis marcescibilis TaxID=230819 RepID=A0A5C3KE76_COPMA|nr:hypothetical protein FA15DRAFT_268208 [Coprinopsis marcescibilis]